MVTMTWLELVVFMLITGHVCVAAYYFGIRLGKAIVSRLSDNDNSERLD